MNLERLFASLDHYRVVLKPDRDQSEWWAGAPSVVVAQYGTFISLRACGRVIHCVAGEVTKFVSLKVQTA
ncbi:MAG TPA: hypothetical protein PKN04_15460 [bacterium]|nr:hypothetical protein [bacterium]HNT67181.1 hypothetical protein [bacterium]HOX86100.1 hypothetical protein [bacterium]HPG45686.1 hypothetical protein [bacterium]HPM97535.1 hypothetical protein [bacterium]